MDGGLSALSKKKIQLAASGVTHNILDNCPKYKCPCCHNFLKFSVKNWSNSSIDLQFSEDNPTAFVFGDVA